MTAIAWMFISTLTIASVWAIWMAWKGLSAPSEGFRDYAIPPGDARRYSGHRAA